MKKEEGNDQALNQGFFRGLLRCGQNGDHPRNNLAKFGCRPEVANRIEKKTFLLWNCAKKLNNFLTKYIE
jgi:hypothetical protein